jgi:DNA-binding transcriptional MerR regulator
MSTPETQEMLRMGELAEASGVSAATIKHYLREGLLPEPVKTSRNMAYYPADTARSNKTMGFFSAALLQRASAS